jgi:hypothetical protein
MPALSSAEHAAVHRATKDERNARAWVRRHGGRVLEAPYFGGTHYTVTVPGFMPAYGVHLDQVVATLRFAEANCRGERGPTGTLLRGADGC